MVSFGLQEDGVSLIELMVTITILSILVLAGTSLTGLWSKQAELDKATMSLKSAMSLSRSIAIRNQFAKNMNDTASQMCFDATNKEITVHKATATGSASCGSPIVFSYPLSPTIDIKNTNNTNFNCFAFNNFGRIMSDNAGNCINNVALTISNGSLNERRFNRRDG